MGAYEMLSQNGRNFQDFRLGEGDVLDHVTEGMLQNNEIKRSVPMQVLHHNGSTVYRYNISGMMPLKYVYEDNMNKKRFLGILEGILESLLDAEEYMIDPTYVDWDYANIYVDEKNSSAKLLYLPVKPAESDFNIYRFLRNFIFSARLDMSENGAYHSELIHFLNSSNEGSFSMRDFLLLVRRIKNDAPAAAPAPAPAAASRTVPPAPQPVQERVRRGAAAAPAVSDELDEVDEREGPERAANRPPVYKSKPRQPAAEEEEDSRPATGSGSAKKLGDMFRGIKQKIIGDADDKTAAPGFAMPGDDSLDVSKQNHRKPVQQEPVQQKPVQQKPVQQRPAQQAPAQQRPVQQRLAQQAPAQQKPVQQRPAQQQPKNYTAPAAANRQGTIYYDQIDSAKKTQGTVMIADEMLDEHVKRAYLIRKKNNERIPVKMSNGRFRIGASTERDLEYIIRDNQYVSGFHAQVNQKNDSYYILDMNSSNGTKLNGERIYSNKEHPLASGDKIVFANDEYEFVLE